MYKPFAFVTGLCLSVVGIVGCQGASPTRHLSPLGAPASSGAHSPGATTVEVPDARSAAPGTPAMGSPWPFLHTEFHFEMGRQVFAVGDDGRVRELLSRHEQHKVRTYCAKVTTPSDRDLCKQLRANGDTEFVSMSWFVAEYSLTEVERRDGAARLLEANIPSLNRSYDASDLDDGVTSTYRASFAGAPSEVSVYSAGTPGEPPALAPVRDWVRAVQAAHGPERAAAKPVADADHAATERALLSAS